MKKLFLIFVLLPLLALNAGSGIGENDVCQSSPAFAWNGTSIGGVYLPSSGTIKVLFVFAQFPDDKYYTTNSGWVKCSAPAAMNTWVDET